MTGTPVRVVKLGGSLFDWPGWVETFQKWLANQVPATNVLIVGGGAIVEHLRMLDREFSLAPETAHWLAVRAMSINAGIAAARLPMTPLVHSLAALSDSSLGALAIFDIHDELRGMPADVLPRSWDVTSDSIAARMAERLGAAELVLLKSTLPAESLSKAAAARAGYVDAFFPSAADCVSVRCVDLRDSRFREMVLFEA